MTRGTLLSLAWRESRFARRRLFLFLSAISLGVAGLVAVQGFASNMVREVREQARAMLGADVTVAAREPFGEGTEAVLDSLAAAGVPIARSSSFASMALHPGTGATRLVQVRAPEPEFPFYGTIDTQPAGRWARLHQGRNILVDPALMVALGAQVGDSIAIGATRFELIGALEKIPGDVEVASSFAPRVFIPNAYLEETELLGFGARVDFEAYLRIPDPAEARAFVTGYRPLWRSERVRTRTIEDQQRSMEEALGRMSDYLGLVAVFALLLGGIGVASAMSAYMARKSDSVAVLRCLGATSRQVLGVYLTQAAAMGLAGAAVGVVLGSAVQWVLPRLLEGLLPVDVRITLDGVAMLTGLFVGLWAAVAFALLPLLRVRRVSPLGALRRGVEPLRAPGHDWIRYGAWALLGGSVLLLILVQAGQIWVGAWVAGGIAGTLVVLYLTAMGLMRLARHLPRNAFAYTVRQGLANLYRPGNQTATVILALGFGLFLLATLFLTQTNILRPLFIEGETRGNLILWDVQEDQVPGVAEIMGARGVPVIQSAPIIPMRIAAIRGVAVRPWTDPSGTGESGPRDPDAPTGWAVRREYRSTYRDSIVASEQVIAGAWWNGEAAELPGVSLERDLAADLGVAVGDRIDWDVLGIRVATTVTSLREVDWARFEPNFFAVFEPEALRGAPQTWVMLARAGEAEQRALVQRDVVQRYPNVSALDLSLLQRALDDVIGRISSVIRFLAGFSIATGFVVLLGAIATGRLQRIRESVLLKTLGATRRQIGTILFTEYFLLGALAMVAGIGLAIAAGWGLARFLFDVPFVVEPLPLLALGLGAALLAAAVGLWASQEVFSSTPMEAIREE